MYGAGTYPGAADVNVDAYPNNGYRFVNWTENGSVISTSPLLNFKAHSDRTLVANFEAVLPIIATPTLSPNGGVFHKKRVKVSASCATRGALIVYTTGGGDPGMFSARWRKKGLKITGKGQHTIKAKGIVSAYIDSEIVTAIFTIQ